MKKILYALLLIIFAVSLAVHADEGDIVRLMYDFNPNGVEIGEAFSGYGGNWGEFQEYTHDGIADTGLMFDKTKPSAYINAGQGLSTAFTGNFEINFDVYPSGAVDFSVYTRHFTVKSSGTSNSGMQYKEEIIHFHNNLTLEANSGKNLPSSSVPVGYYVPGTLYRFKAVYHGSNGVDGSYSVYLVKGLIQENEASEASLVEDAYIGTFSLESNYAGIGALYFMLSTDSDEDFAILDNFSVVLKPAELAADDSVTVGVAELKVNVSNFIPVGELEKIKVFLDGRQLAANTDYRVSSQLKTQHSSSNVNWCVNPIIQLSKAVEEDEYYVVDLSGLSDNYGRSFQETLFTMPRPADEYIFEKIKKNFDEYISNFAEFGESTALNTTFSSEELKQFQANVAYQLINTSDISNDEFNKIISIDDEGFVSVNRPGAETEESFLKLGNISGILSADVTYEDFPPYTCETSFVVKRTNFFENYIGEGGVLEPYKTIFDDDDKTQMQFDGDTEIAAEFDGAQAFGGFVVAGENIKKSEIYYRELDTDEMKLFGGSPIKTDKLVFKISGSDIVITDILAFCSKTLDEKFSNETIFKNYDFELDGETITESRIYLPDVINKYIHIDWEISDDSVIDRFGNVFKMATQKSVTLTAYMLDENGERISDITNVSIVTVPAKETFQKGGTSSSSGGGRGGSAADAKYYPGTTAEESGLQLPPVKPRIPFQDVGETHWAYETIAYLYENNIVNGKTAEAFHPEDYVKREEFVKMLIDAAGISGPGYDINFSDVASEDWYYNYIKTAYNTDIVQGISSDEFGVDTCITREDICVMIDRALNYAGEKLSAANDEIEFKDADEVSGYAKDSIVNMVASGILSGYGDGTVRPKAFATRAECSKMIYTLMETIGLVE